MVKFSVELSLDELRPLLIPQVQQAITDSQLTQPNAVVKGFNIADQHYQNPILLLDPNQLQLSCESEAGQPIALLIVQPVVIEAHKKEARIRHAVFPLTHAGQLETVDEHAKLVSGNINIHATADPLPTGQKLSDVKLTLHFHAQAVQLKPEIDLGQALPIPGVKDIIQGKFKEQLEKAQEKTQQKEVVYGLGDKVPEQYKNAVLNKAEVNTNASKNGVVVEIEASM